MASLQPASPIMGIFEAILAWQRDPTEEMAARIAGSLARLARSIGASGAFLETEATELAPLAVGDRKGGSRGGPTADSPGRVALGVDGSDARLGWLWLDEPRDDPSEAIRAVEIALGAAWSRARDDEAGARLEALDAATRGIAGVIAVERVLQLIVDRARDLVRAEYAALSIADDRGEIERFVTSGISREQRELIGHLPRGRGVLGLILREARAYRIPDIAADPSSYGFPPGHPAMRSLLGVPIRVKGRVIGTFYLTNKRGAVEFRESDQVLVEMFALIAGVAIDHARLHEQLQQMTVVEERERIGKDLHDGIIQSIYAVGLSLEDVPELMRDSPAEAEARIDRAIDALNVAIRDIRNFIFGLRPELAEHGGLIAGLAAIADELRLNAMIDVEFYADEEMDLDLPVDVRAELLQVAREALSNVARHSRASRATVRVGRAGADLELVITDNGRGFRLDEPRGPGHQGLPNIAARIADLGGQLRIESELGTGTRIIVRLPVPADEAQPRATTR